MVRFSVFAFALVFATGASAAEPAMGDMQIVSPGGVLTLNFSIRDGVPTYRVDRQGQAVVRASRLGLQLKAGPALDSGLKLLSQATNQVDRTWKQPWGEQTEIRDRHNELSVKLGGAAGDGRRLDIVFRVFDDGVGFRYRIPEQPGLGAIEISDEVTEFAMTGDHKTWWLPAYQQAYSEYHYTESPLTRTDKILTPVTLKTEQGLYLSIHEAALIDYASMVLHRREGTTFKADLVPWSDGIKVRGKAPMESPWRTIQIADSPGGLVESYLILNLNEPCRLKDLSWIKPGKYVGVWWEMHLGKSTWSTGPTHGATTANVKRYLDFAAKNGFDGVLVEGWNQGWDGDWTANGEIFSFTKPTPDFDIEALAKYGRERGVRLIGHHETAGAIDNYERQLEDAFTLYERLGVRAVKTGYVVQGQSILRIDKDGKKHQEWHDGQYMVRHYWKVIETAAKHHVMLDVHEPMKDTGERRTYPNMMTREGACGTEYDAWGGKDHNPPDHTTILPFTRLLAGPMDYTPGIFSLTGFLNGNRVYSTVAKQLALYVIVFSPLHMAADLPENYAARPEPFQFIKDVPTDWTTTKVLNAQIGDFVTIARKDRKSDDWYIGSITDETPRKLSVQLNFLDPGRSYVAEIYRDGKDASWEKNPNPVEIDRQPVDSKSTLELSLASGGGTAIRIRAK